MQEGAQIKARTSRDHWQVAPCRDFMKNRPGEAKIFSSRANVIGVQRIEKMMGYPAPRGRVRLCCPDIKHPVQLQGIAINDFSAEPFGNGERKIALARTCRAKDNREQRLVPHKSMILGQNSVLVTILALGPLRQRQAESTQKASPVE